MAPVPIFLPAVVAATILVSCAGEPGRTTAPVSDEPTVGVGSDAGTPPSRTSEPADAADGNAEVLAFTAPDLEGGTFDGSDYAGRDVILWLWAPW